MSDQYARELTAKRNFETNALELVVIRRDVELPSTAEFVPYVDGVPIQWISAHLVDGADLESGAVITLGRRRWIVLQHDIWTDRYEVADGGAVSILRAWYRMLVPRIRAQARLIGRFGKVTADIWRHNKPSDLRIES